jgi:hypothetical protein
MVKISDGGLVMGVMRRREEREMFVWTKGFI